MSKSKGRSAASSRKTLTPKPAAARHLPDLKARLCKYIDDSFRDIPESPDFPFLPRLKAHRLAAKMLATVDELCAKKDTGAVLREFERLLLWHLVVLQEKFLLLQIGGNAIRTLEREYDLSHTPFVLVHGSKWSDP
jgi:hypothetical protein